jgi:hypothetical protein
MITHDDQLLINAYIDGELAPDERVRAEQLLVEDADARKYREELLSMSANLQALPKHYLPTEFAAEVLQAAEREMFVGTPWPTTQTESATTAGNRWARRLTYAGATIAAAILVALFIPNNEQPVAQQEADVVAKPAAEQLEKQASKQPASPAKPQVGAAKIEQPKDDAEEKSVVGDFDAKPKLAYSARREDPPSTPAPLDSVASDTLTLGKDAPRFAQVSEPELMVVSVEMSQAAPLQKLLAGYKIQSHAGAGYRSGPAANLGEDARKAARSQFSRPASQPPVYQTTSPTIYAEMTRAQLDQVVAQMKADTKRFSSVAMFGGAPAQRGRLLAQAAASKEDAKKLLVERTTNAGAAADPNSSDKLPLPGIPSATVGKIARKPEDEKDTEGDSSAIDELKDAVAANVAPLADAAAGAGGFRADDAEKSSVAKTRSRDRKNKVGESGKGGKSVSTPAERIRVLFVLRTPLESTTAPTAKQAPAAVDP